MADPISACVRSTVFGERNLEKGNNGQVARYSVAAGQSKKVYDSIMEYDKAVGFSNKTAINAVKNVADKVKTVAKSDVVVDYACKAVNFASKNVNPLICLSSGIDVLTAEDKTSALVTNAAGLGAMFTVEHYMHDKLDDGMKKIVSFVQKAGEKNKTIANICEKVAKSGHGGKLASIAKGLAFVVGSCTAYSVGENMGKSLIGEQDKA